MPRLAARPPKAGTKAAAAAKAKKATSKDDLSSLVTVFDGMGVDSHDDEGRVATGVLISELRARDIKINAFSLALHGAVLVEDTVIELNQGARYGLLGRNGCGKFVMYLCLSNTSYYLVYIF